MAQIPQMFRGFLGGGGGDGGGQGQGQGDGTHGTGEVDDTRTGGELNQGEDESLDDIIGSIFGEEEEPDGQQDPNGNPIQPHQQGQQGQQQQQQVQPQGQNPNPNDPGAALAAEMNAVIKGLKIDESVIPEDFNPADSKQLRDLLGTVQQQGVMTAIQLAMKPMQLAMESQMKQIQTMVRNEINNGISGNDSQRTLREMVPEVDDENLGGMVKAMYDTALKKTKNPAKAAGLIRKALDSMGLKKGGGNSGGGDPFTGGFKQGGSALDSFLPAPQRNR